jgi:hypothetical protein
MSDTDSLQKEVLMGIGRNVLNLQKMEGMLKALVLMASSKVPLDGMADAISKRREAVFRMPMGSLIELFVQSVHPIRNADSAQTTDFEGAGIEHSFRFEDAAFVDELKASLRTIVKERNQLIHRKLIEFDPKSSKSCRSLAKELEEQRERIKPQFERLANILTMVRDQMRELDEYFKSEEFASSRSSSPWCRKAACERYAGARRSTDRRHPSACSSR